MIYGHLPAGAKVMWGSTDDTPSEHGTIVNRHLTDDGSVLYEVETSEGYTYGVFASEIEAISD